MILSGSENGGTTHGTTSKFHVDHDINAKLYLWRGTPWALEVDAVVNSSNEVNCALFRSKLKDSAKSQLSSGIYIAYLCCPLSYNCSSIKPPEYGQQNLDEAHSSPGLHPAAGPGLAEECATLVSICDLLPAFISLFGQGRLNCGDRLPCYWRYLNRGILVVALFLGILLCRVI